MKKSILFSAIAAIVLFAGSFTASAQTKKIGHVSLSEIIAAMPEKASADTAYNAYSRELEAEYYAMEKELRDMMADYESGKATRSEGMNKIKEDKIVAKQQEMQQFAQVTIQNELQEKQYKLTLPIIEKVEKIVKEVAKEKGFAYVFDRSEGSMLVWDDADALDADVRKKLGLPAASPATPK